MQRPPQVTVWGGVEHRSASVTRRALPDNSRAGPAFRW